MAGRCVLSGKHPEGRDSCLRVGHLQQQLHIPVPAGSGEVMDTSEVGRCLASRVGRGLQRAQALSRESLLSACKMLPCLN